MLALRKDIELLLPPTRKVEKFNVTINAPEFPKYSGGWARISSRAPSITLQADLNETDDPI